MFWGAFSFFRKSELVPLFGHPNSPRGGVNAQRILETLQAQLPGICDPGSIFIQDNASTHTAALVQDWLIPWAEEEGVELIDWPPYSPDLNPIENLWKLLKQEICKRYPELADLPKSEASLAFLRRAAVEVWNDFPNELLQELVDSMTRRMAAVEAANGWYTKY
jgi:transposase